MKSSTLSHIYSRKEQVRQIKGQVLNLLGWDEETYGQFQYDQGLVYLDAYINDEYAQDLIIRSRVFWNWWKNNWTNRDMAFVRDAGKVTRSTRINLYQGLHDGKTLASEIYPNGVVLGETYASMIGILIDQNL